ncbi:sulfotransferase domain-containing protein [Roseibium sp.]|uniref:sulfotransferase domain-containing protein n=1 Tax=Roseibium sp. TaxID=1936156 RepID=UPI003A97DB20
MQKFVLGIGAQKSGTTWLYEYISKDYRFRRGPVKPKELHVWNHREISEFHEKRRRLTNAFNLSRLYLWRMEKSDYFYFDYFTNLLKHGGIAVDITPAYSGLSQGTLIRINDEFAKRNILLQCVFLMRDPVARCVSGFGHNRSRSVSREVRQGAPRGKEVNESFREYFKSESCMFRTRYDITIKNALSAFGKEKFGAFLYEDIFKGDGLQQLADFLEMPPRPELLDRKANVARKSYEIEESAKRECAQFYAETYAYVSALIPSAKATWKGMQYL